MTITGEERADRGVLIVDPDGATRQTLLRLATESGYGAVAVATFDDALEALRNDPFAIVLMDITTSDVASLDLLRHVIGSYPDTASVIVTGHDDPAVAEAALGLGAYGYIVKPFQPNEIIINLMNTMRRRTLEIENRTRRERLEQMVKERTAELWTAIGRLEQAEKEIRTSREETVERLSIAAEFRDDETARHIQRMSRYCGLLGERLGWDKERCEMIRVASVMHDVGKIGTPDHILLKPGTLTPEEREEMQRHSEIGHQILSGSTSPFLQMAAAIALTHHERFDGAGYPQGLQGTDIPVEGRIAAVADVFDALTSDRVYRKAMPIGKAVDIMREGRGAHFDPELLDCFLDVLDLALGVREQYADVAPAKRSWTHAVN